MWTSRKRLGSYREGETIAPDLIVTDLSMLVMNGLEEARVLKKLMPAVPVIMYTGHSGRFLEKEARAVGVDAVISRSENASALIGRARTLLINLPFDCTTWSAAS